MKNIEIQKLMVVTGILLLSTVSVAENRVLTGKIVKVQDGDSVKLLDANKQLHTIRLAGIDAPETRRFHGVPSPQPFSKKSKAVLAELVFGQRVKANCHKKDRYDRNVC